jgi:hypothetical protein
MRLLRWFGIVVDELTRDEAARVLLEREVRVVVRPVIVEVTL